MGWIKPKKTFHAIVPLRKWQGGSWQNNPSSGLLWRNNTAGLGGKGGGTRPFQTYILYKYTNISRAFLAEMHVQCACAYGGYRYTTPYEYIRDS